MTLRKVALALGATALCVGSAASTATAHARPANSIKPCAISLYAKERQVYVGEKVEIYGQLQCAGKGVAETGVNISARFAGHPHGKLLGTVTTNTEGNFAAEIPSISVNAELVASYKGRYARDLSVRVTPQVTFTGPAERSVLYSGRASAVPLGGTVTPYDVGARVYLQRQDAFTEGVWHTIQATRVKAGGLYSFMHRFSVPGTATLRVMIPRHGRYTGRAISESHVYEVDQSQLTGLTLKTSHEPVLWGTTVTFEGVSSAGEGKTVTLYSHSVHGGPWVKVAEATTGAGGAYSVTHDARESREYRAWVGTTRSAVIVEGVHYGVTLSGSWPASLNSGEKLVASGSVTGAPAGHRVLLERENVFGRTFRVIGSTTVNTEGKFTLETVLLGSGPVAVRVKVPGDLGHRSAWSNTAAIDLTPAPPTLTLPTPTPVLPIS